MADERAHLAQCDQHIAKAREHIRKQEQLIERGGGDGQDLDEAKNLLAVLIGTLNTFEEHRLLVLARLQP